MKLQNGVLLSEDSVLHYFVQVCMALKYLHGNRMLRPRDGLSSLSDVCPVLKAACLEKGTEKVP